MSGDDRNSSSRGAPALPDEIVPAAGPAALPPQPTTGFPRPSWPGPQPWPPRPLRSLRCGCYLINYTPTGNFFGSYDGTLRVECHSNGRTASGDLYQRPVIILPVVPETLPNPGRPRFILGTPPDPAAGIPILPRDNYRYYLRVTHILEGYTPGYSFDLGFEMHRFDQATRSWTNEGAFTAVMSWTPAPASYPSPGDYLTGDVRNSAGTIVGRLGMGWLSKYLRKATIEIDRVSPSEAPLDNASGVDWKAVGDGIDWDITVDPNDADVAEPSGESWSNAECHASMLARRKPGTLDAEWRYHILCVRRLDATQRGIMYDNGATDSNNVPREGCAIATHWVIPNQSQWGLVQGQRFGAAPKPYYRTAVHETGHAMGLYHNTADNGYMNTTDVIAAGAMPANPFPNNILWSFAADDQRRLRHMPDIYVRPGGTPFGTSYATTPISPADRMVEAPGLILEVSPLLEAVPLGAPVRVNIQLTNNSGAPMEAPPSLSLGSGFVRGQVTDPSGTVRTFSPLVLCVDQESPLVLAPGKSLSNSLTLLRGGQGALFPTPGLHCIRVEARWDLGGVEAIVTGETVVIVTSAVDEGHASTALKLLTTPDAQLTLVLGGDHLEKGIEAIQAALENSVLRPHYAHIEAKRLGDPFGKRKANLNAAAALIDEATVMSPDEVKRAAELVKKVGAETASAKEIASTLKARVAQQDVSASIRKMVDEL